MGTHGYINYRGHSTDTPTQRTKSDTWQDLKRLDPTAQQQGENINS